jgi:predicted transcriptional regulator
MDGATMPDDHNESAHKHLADLPAEARGEMFRRFRNEMGYSLEDVALTSGLTEAEIALLEKGDFSHPNYISRLAHALGMPDQ